MKIELSLKINNVTVESVNSPIRITNEFPIFNWDLNLVERYSVDETTGVPSSLGNFGKKGYEIEISTSDKDLGESFFVGEVSRTGFVLSEDGFWEYSGEFLQRGQVYYGQIYAIDDLYRISEIKTFSFLYNSLPRVENVEITPSTPSPTDDLELNYDFYDDDGDLESGTTIRWFKNGSYQKQFDNATIVKSSFLQNNDIWNVDIYPSDGFEYGERVTSPFTKVVSTAVEVSDLSVSPPNPNTEDILKANYLISDEFESDNVLIRWYVNEQIRQDVNDQQFVRLDLSAGDIVRFESKHNESNTYLSSSSVTILSSDFIVTNIMVDGKINPLNVSTLTPHVKWQRFVPDDKSVNYISIKIGTFFESDNVYSTTITGDRDSFLIPANTLEKGRDYYISIAISDTLTFNKYTSSHFRVNGSRWEEDVSNTTGWTFETLFVVKGTTSDYQVVRINDGTRFAEIRIYIDKIRFISGSQVDYIFSATTNNFLSVAGKGDDIKIYINRELAIDGTGLFTKETDAKILEIGDFLSTQFAVSYKYFFYTTSGYFLPGEASVYNNIQFHDYIEFEDNEVVSLKGYIDGKYIFGLNPDDENEGGLVYALKAGELSKTSSISRTFSPINRITKSPDGKIVVGAHAKGVTVINGYFIDSFNNELIFVDANGNVNEVYPTSNGWELVNNAASDSVYFSDEGLHIDTL